MRIRTVLRAGAAAVALATVPAIAQEGQTAESGGGYGAFANVAVSDLVGQTVRASTGEAVGEVEVLVARGSDVTAVLGVGGFLGFGEHDVEVPLTELTLGDGALMLETLDLPSLEAMPAYAGDGEEMPMNVTVAGEPLPEATPEAPVAPETPVETN